MENNLYDERGYQIKLVFSKVFNATKNDAIKGKGVFVKYIGPVTPTYSNADFVFDNDAYVMSRLDFANGNIWNPQAVNGFHEPEENGVWTSKESLINLKEPGIRKSGLKIEYVVPEQMSNCSVKMQIWVNNELLEEKEINDQGEYSLNYDVNHIGRENLEYIEQAHKLLMIMLKEIDRICDKYCIHYYLICGSLLGAVRNKKFIPWDDDVDIAMPRKDFNKFVKCIKKEWDKDSDYKLVDYNQMGNHAFLDFMTRVVYMKEEIPVGVYRKIHGKGRSDIENHMPVDIYVLDNAFENEKIHKLQTNIITLLYGLAIGHRAYVDYDEYARRGKKTQTIVKILSKIGRCIPLGCILFFYENVRKWNRNEKSEDVFESNGFIYCIPWKFKRKWFGEGVQLPLDDMMVSVPADYDAFLKMHYWDYMQLPPMGAREPTHSVKASGIF